MNERIRLLAIEARLITVDGITRYALDHEFEQRFAKLIVQECAGIAHGSDRPSADIKHHFGIEE